MLHHGLWLLSAVAFVAMIVIPGPNHQTEAAPAGPREKYLERFQHAGHWYLERDVSATADQPFIHDPDCPCRGRITPEEIERRAK